MRFRVLGGEMRLLRAIEQLRGTVTFLGAGARIPAPRPAAFLREFSTRAKYQDDAAIGEGWHLKRIPPKKAPRKERVRASLLKERYIRHFKQTHPEEKPEDVKNKTEDVRILRNKDGVVPRIPFSSQAVVAAETAVTVKKTANTTSATYVWCPPFKKPRAEYKVGRPLPPKKYCSKHPPPPVVPSKKKAEPLSKKQRTKKAARKRALKVPPSKPEKKVRLLTRAQKRTLTHQAKWRA